MPTNRKPKRPTAPAGLERTETAPRSRLTDEGIRRSGLPTLGRRQQPDAIVGGLWLRTSATGSRSWSVAYRGPNGSTRRLTLGKWPGISCATARQMARDALVAIQQGRDPAREKAEKRHANGDTVREVAADYLHRQC